MQSEFESEICSPIAARTVAVASSAGFESGMGESVEVFFALLVLQELQNDLAKVS